jgi:hypothetical protein
MRPKQTSRDDPELWMQEIKLAERDLSWSIPFEAPRAPERKEPTRT